MTLTWGAAVAVVTMATTAGAEKDMTIVFSKEANRHAVSGFGGEWEPHFWRELNTRRGCNEKEWETVCRQIREMGVARVRMAILPDWYEPENENGDATLTDPGAFTWDSEHMHSLYRHLDYCQESGIRVTLTWWCAPIERQSDGAPFWLATPGVKAWCSAPNDVEEAAENAVAGLVYLIERRGYTCIDSFTFYNEPDWAFYGPGDQVDFDHYAAICQAIHRRLKEVGLRDRLTLDLADASAHGDWLQKSVENLGDAADRFNVHSYVFSTEDPDYAAAIRAWVRKWVQQCGDKPLATNELGTRHYVGAYSVTDLETFERGFLAAQYAVLALNEGMTGALFWGLYDQYYYEGKPDDGSNGGLMKTNLMGYVTEGWKIRPSGQAWTLICHGAPRGAKVHAARSDDPDTDAVATVSEAGAVNVLLVNRSKEARRLRLDGLPGKAGETVPATARTYTRAGLASLEPDAYSKPGVVAVPAESVTWVAFPTP